MAEPLLLNPQTGESDYSPLSALIRQAIALYGDSAPNAVSGETTLMMIGFANDVVDEINKHPYWTGGMVDYYHHDEDRRPVPDTVIKAGLLAHYARQQRSDKAQAFFSQFFRTMNGKLFGMQYGNGKLSMQIMR